ncbi:MAG: histidine kinase [Ruminiclostridium sp.]|nr:histidine kinase [Ruminiclostridium sp.]
MKTTGRRRKLLVQIVLIMIPVFLFMICAVAQTIYISSVNSYLKAQEKQLTDVMNDSEAYLPLQNNIFYPDDGVRKWFLDNLAERHLYDAEDLTDEETGILDQHVWEEDMWQLSWYERMSEPVKEIVIKELLIGARRMFEKATMNSSFENIIMVNASDKERMRVLVDFDHKNSESDTGKYFDLDLSKHAVLRELFESNSGEIVFERTSSLPIEGNFYMCYYPVMIDGSIYSVIGLAYDWDDLRQSVINTIISTIVIIIIGMIVLMSMILLHLYIRTVSPAAKIQKALLEYAKDKNTSGIVRKMYEVKANNELGYLADTIADLALEIELYTRENIRIAVAKERTEKELYEAKVAVMTSQIRPHFMYNALTSIAMMCELDPKTAKQATITFAKYLRGNMDSLKQTTPVPFEKELEHLKNYLYIEKLRFDDLLNIEYDIKTTAFEVPLLSIQPLVENAVKHGVGMKEDGGTVTIATRETDSAYEVIISDDGVGFDTNAEKKDDGRSHVGMENTRKRLKDMCGADIAITSEVGVGTTVTVTIPKKEDNDENTVS